MERHVVIVGNGVAGFAAARRLRREDPDVTVSLFSDEPHPFYLRSRLKDYIAGALGDYEVILESRNLYRRERLNLFLQSPVLGLDTENREVLLRGERVRYDRLLLAMGCSPASLGLPGADLAGVLSLRTLSDAEAIRQWMATRRRAVVIGEGIVSVHLAEALARMGAEVEYTLLGEHFWPDVLDPTASAIVEEVLTELGVRIRKRVRVSRILGSGGSVCGVELDGGEVIPCDMLGHGCSFRPATELLAATAVACSDGVTVNEYLETNVDGVYAAGDVISLGVGNGAGQFGQRWRNSFLLGEAAALNMLDRRTPVRSFAASLKTEVCGTSLAVIGRGQLAEVDPSVQVESTRSGRGYRRLVFQNGFLAGGILVGDTSHAELIEDHVRRGTLREDIEESLMPALLADEPRLTKPLDTTCPICTDRVHLAAGVLVGREFRCDSCRTRLKLSYSEGRLAVVPA